MTDKTDDALRKAIAGGLTEEAADPLMDAAIAVVQDAARSMDERPNLSDHSALPEVHRLLDLVFVGLLYEQGYL